MAVLALIGFCTAVYLIGRTTTRLLEGIVNWVVDRFL